MLLWVGSLCSQVGIGSGQSLLYIGVFGSQDNLSSRKRHVLKIRGIPGLTEKRTLTDLILGVLQSMRLSGAGTEILSLVDMANIKMVCELQLTQT